MILVDKKLNTMYSVIRASAVEGQINVYYMDINAFHEFEAVVRRQDIKVDSTTADSFKANPKQVASCSPLLFEDNRYALIIR